MNIDISKFLTIIRYLNISFNLVTIKILYSNKKTKIY